MIGKPGNIRELNGEHQPFEKYGVGDE